MTAASTAAACAAVGVHTHTTSHCATTSSARSTTVAPVASANPAARFGTASHTAVMDASTRPASIIACRPSPCAHAMIPVPTTPIRVTRRRLPLPAYCCFMSIAITDDHRALADTVSDFLLKHDSRGAARALLEAPTEGLPPFWDVLCGLGWLGLHIDEAHGGSGYGLPELAVVVEETGRAMAPGPFVPTVIASAVIAASASEDIKGRLLPGLASGTTRGCRRAQRQGRSARRRQGQRPGRRGARRWPGRHRPGAHRRRRRHRRRARRAASPSRCQPTSTRRGGRPASPSTAPQVEVIPGAGQALVDLARTILAAEATGMARECTVTAAEYAKVRHQFGRPIATYQGVKHHCANMLVAVELATAAVWDAARAAAAGGDQFSYTAAMAATLAIPAADHNANLNIQVHGGIGFTWEHDAHLYLRRATALGAIIDGDVAAADVTDLARDGVRRARTVDLPPEAEAIRDTVRAYVARASRSSPSPRSATR